MYPPATMLTEGLRRERTRTSETFLCISRPRLGYEQLRCDSRLLPKNEGIFRYVLPAQHQNLSLAKAIRSQKHVTSVSH